MYGCSGKFKLPKNFGNIVLIIKFVHSAFNTYMLQLIVTNKYVEFFQFTINVFVYYFNSVQGKELFVAVRHERPLYCVLHVI